jgi:hypothetical protein
MTFEYIDDAKEQLASILGSADEFEDQVARTMRSARDPRITTRALTPGMSGASVFLVSRLADGKTLSALVVKAASEVSLIKTERDNYEHHVHDRLKSAPALVPLGSSRLLAYDFGGALAAFKPVTLRAGYQHASPEALAALMTRIVQSLGVLHSVGADTISCARRVVFGPALEERLASWPKLPQASVDRLLELLAQVAKHEDRFPGVYMTGHGDLNAGNVLFEAGPDASYPVFIDFASIERTKDNRQYPRGQHFPFWDYAKLERDVKTRLFFKEAVAEGLQAAGILEAVRTLDGAKATDASAQSGAVKKLFMSTRALREGVRANFAPRIYGGCYPLAVAYATVSVLYRKEPDNDVPLDLQALVAVESAIALLDSAMSEAFGAAEAGPAPSTSNVSSRIEREHAARAEQLLLRLYDFKGTCVIGHAKGEADHVYVPGYGVDMQWGAASEDDRLAWLYVVRDLLEKGLLQKTGRESEYQLSDAGQRQGWLLSQARRTGGERN